MNPIIRSGFLVVKNAVLSTTLRSIALTSQLNLKQIRKQREGDKLIIEAVKVPSPRTQLMVKAEELAHVDEDHKSCYLCALNLDVKHTDVLILSQFVRTDGCMLPRRITGLCPRQQKKVGKMVTMAQKAGLMINLTPRGCKRDPRKRKDHKKFNTYFDEDTIFARKLPKQEDNFRRSGSIYR